MLLYKIYLFISLGNLLTPRFLSYFNIILEETSEVSLERGQKGGGWHT